MIKMKNKYKLFLSVLLVGSVISACSGLGNNANGALTASGTITAKSVNIAPEIGGKIAEIFVSEGETVTAGKTLYEVFGLTILFRIALNIGSPIAFLRKKKKLKLFW